MGASILAVDIGGSKIDAGLVLSETGEVLTRHRMPTPRMPDGESLFRQVLELATAAINDVPDSPPNACGVGCGGPMSLAERWVSPNNLPQWSRFPLASRLEDHFGLITHVDNDGKAMTLAEGWLGAAAGKENYIGMVVSTGIGGGVVMDGRLLDGADGNAGHIGHVVVEPGGRRRVGIEGSLEGEASGMAIENATGRPAAEAGMGWRRKAGTLVGRVVGGLANMLDIDLAVVAGSVALGYGRPFFESAQVEIDAVARLEHSQGARIVPAALGSDAPLIGAAAVSLYRTGLLSLGMSQETGSR